MSGLVRRVAVPRTQGPIVESTCKKEAKGGGSEVFVRPGGRGEDYLNNGRRVECELG